MTDRSFRSILTGSFSTPCAKNPTVAMMEAGYAKRSVWTVFPALEENNRCGSMAYVGEQWERITDDTP